MRRAGLAQAASTSAAAEPVDHAIRLRQLRGRPRGPHDRKRAHARCVPRRDAGRRVLDHHAISRRDPEALRRDEEHVRRGLAVGDLVARHGHGERVGQAGAAQRAVEPRARRRRRHRDAHAPPVQLADRLERVGERLELVVDQREQRPGVLGPEGLGRRQPRDALGEERVAALVRKAKQTTVVRLPDGVAVVPQPLVPRAAGERLGVDERAVAVEDHRGGVDAGALDHDGGELDQTRGAAGWPGLYSASPRADGGIGRRARLRAWSGITGWRFESSSAHLQ